MHTNFFSVSLGPAVSASRLLAQKNGQRIPSAHVATKGTAAHHVTTFRRAPTPIQQFVKTPATHRLVATTQFRVAQAAPIVLAHPVGAYRTIDVVGVVPEIVHRNADFDDGFAGSVHFSLKKDFSVGVRARHTKSFLQSMTKTYAITFAGRQDRMSLLVDRMRAALDRGIIDEWHVWNYARTPEDHAWVDTLEAHNIFVKHPAEKSTYRHVYEHYDAKDYLPDDVFLKLDDDIVFVDVDALARMIQFRRDNPKPFIISANVINNPVCFMVQKEMGLLKDIECPDLNNSGDQATALHRAFLAGTQFAFEKAVEIRPEFLMNINCIMWLGSDIDNVRLCETHGSDELSLGNVFPKLLQRPVGVYGPCVVSHLSFYTQDAAMPIAELLEEYKVT